MSKSKIEWCTDTWNPVYGCTPVSPGCENCYAKNWHDRFKDGNFSVVLKPEKLLEPLKATKPKRYFVGSMTDIFHDDVPDEFLDKMFAVMALAEWHTFMILTKRPERMLRYLSDEKKVVNNIVDCGLDIYFKQCKDIRNNKLWSIHGTPTGLSRIYSTDVARNKICSRISSLKNIWFGVTAENQEQADKRIPILLDTPAAHRFVSVEPMLDYVDLDYLVHDSVAIDALAGSHGVFRPLGGKNNKLDWVICGGESGRGARFLHPDLVRKLRDQCKKTKTPFFFKQWGEHDSTGKRVGKKVAGRLLDGEGVMEWPRSLKPL